MKEVVVEIFFPKREEGLTEIRTATVVGLGVLQLRALLDRRQQRRAACGFLRCIFLKNPFSW
jgi:hypothetical protein